jgi:uncharacterized protein GlcG (DUF336 family)
MVFAVSDLSGNVLGLYRMPDAPFFSIDVAVAKARNVSYYDDPNPVSGLRPIDRVQGLPSGVQMTNRTFRFLALPTFPEGIQGSEPAPFSSLNDPGINKHNAENLGAPLAASVYATALTSVLGFAAFNPNRNFRDPLDIRHQNGVVFFPGSTPLFKNLTIVGGSGASGDGVDQDDVITYYGAQGYVSYLTAASILTADEVTVRNVRLPMFKFPRNATSL